MKTKIIAEFSAYGKTIMLISHNLGKDGYTVFTRVNSDFDLDDVDFFDSKSSAISRFILILNNILIGPKLPF